MPTDYAKLSENLSTFYTFTNYTFTNSSVSLRRVGNRRSQRQRSRRIIELDQPSGNESSTLDSSAVLLADQIDNSPVAAEVAVHTAHASSSINIACRIEHYTGIWLKTIRSSSSK